jgi:hypothetical protein
MTAAVLGQRSDSLVAALNKRLAKAVKAAQSAVDRLGGLMSSVEVAEAGTPEQIAAWRELGELAQEYARVRTVWSALLTIRQVVGHEELVPVVSDPVSLVAAVAGRPDVKLPNSGGAVNELRTRRAAAREAELARAKAAAEKGLPPSATPIDRMVDARQASQTAAESLPRREGG